MLDWLENPTRYEWIKLEVQDGSLDDVQALRSDGVLEVQQLKFGTPTVPEITLGDMLAISGKGARSRSLLKKWSDSLEDLRSRFDCVEAYLYTNKKPGAKLGVGLDSEGRLSPEKLDSSDQEALSTELGTASEDFFKSFRFDFGQPDADSLRMQARRRFANLGGDDQGWVRLTETVRRWINRKDAPNPERFIRLWDVQQACGWYQPESVVQEFRLPDDYVPPIAFVTDLRTKLLAKRATVVTGNPGSGKSSLLSYLHREWKAAQPVIRHHFFISVDDSTADRHSWHVVADSLIAQLFEEYADLIRDEERINPTPERLRGFLERAGKTREGKSELVVIIDGLDHLLREKVTQTAEQCMDHLASTLFPPPSGVSVILGTQRLDDLRIPERMLSRVPRDEWMAIPPMSREEVRTWLLRQSDVTLPDNDAGIDELVDAFHEVSSGLPLHMRYVLGEVERSVSAISVRSVRNVEPCPRGSTIHEYYGRLWRRTSEGAQIILHLISGFPFQWTDLGLTSILNSRGTALPEVRRDLRSVQHLLQIGGGGISPYHESLLLFVREQKEHSSYVSLFASATLSWLENGAPEHTRWAHLWPCKVEQGDSDPLIEGVSHHWLETCLVEGRFHSEIQKLATLALSESLAEERLEKATEAQFLLRNLAWARDEREEACARLTGLAAKRWPEERLIHECSSLAQRSLPELAALTTSAVEHGSFALAKPLIDRTKDKCSEIDRIFYREKLVCVAIGLAASRLIEASKPNPKLAGANCHLVRPYIAQLLRFGLNGVCSERCLALLRDASADAKEWASDAVNAFLTIAIHLGVRPDLHLSDSAKSLPIASIAMGSASDAGSSAAVLKKLEELFRENDNYAGQDIVDSFSPVGAELFFAAFADRLANRESPVAPNGSGPYTRRFLVELIDLAATAADASKAGEKIGWCWIYDNASTPEPPKNRYETNERWVVEKRSVASVFQLIAVGLEFLVHRSRVEADDLRRAAKCEIWNWSSCVRLLCEQYHASLTHEALGYCVDAATTELRDAAIDLSERALRYSMIAELESLRGQDARADTIDSSAHLAARCALGHGYHKDISLFETLEMIRSAESVSSEVQIEWLKGLWGVMTAVSTELTDGDETKHLPYSYAEALLAVDRRYFPALASHWLGKRDFFEFENVGTVYASLGSIDSPSEIALGSTLVDANALSALESRANAGHRGARLVYEGILSYFGQVRSPVVERSDTDDRSAEIDLNSYDVHEFEHFLRDANRLAYRNSRVLVNGVRRWLTLEPEEEALKRIEHGVLSHGHLPVEFYRELIGIFADYRGTRSVWSLLVDGTKGSFLWRQFGGKKGDFLWFARYVRDHFPKRWCEFIAATTQADFESFPQWDVDRLISYLAVVGKISLVGSVCEVSVACAMRLTADTPLDSFDFEAYEENEVGVRMLMTRLQSPSRVVRERASSASARILAASEHSELLSRELMNVAKQATNEDLVVQVLLILIRARQQGFSVSDLQNWWSNVEAKSILSYELYALLNDSPLENLSEVAFDLFTGSPSPSASHHVSEGFRRSVDAYMAPIFLSLWGKKTEFMRQWEHEAVRLATKLGVDLHYQDHYFFSSSSGQLPAHALQTSVLESAFLRALAALLHKGKIDEQTARDLSTFVCPVDPFLWESLFSQRPLWLPRIGTSETTVDTNAETILGAVRSELLRTSGPTLIALEGPVGREYWLKVRAFLWRREGPLDPSKMEIGEIVQGPAARFESHWTAGKYSCSDPHATSLSDLDILPFSAEAMIKPNWWFPSSPGHLFLVHDGALGSSIEFRPTLSGGELVSAGKQVGASGVWFEEASERFDRSDLPKGGVYLSVPRSILCSIESLQAMQIGWLVTLQTPSSSSESGRQLQTVSEELVGVGRVLTL